MDETQTTAVATALERLAALIHTGAPPGGVIEAVGHIVADWAGETDMDAATAQARIEQMWDSVSRDEAELQEQIADADGADQRALALAKRVLLAMQAAVAALAAAHQRF